MGGCFKFLVAQFWMGVQVASDLYEVGSIVPGQFFDSLLKHMGRNETLFFNGGGPKIKTTRKGWS